MTIQNEYQLPKADILEYFNRVFKEQEICSTDLHIINSHPYFNDENFSMKSCKTDCMISRTLGTNGVYSCPFLANDYRGRVGSDFKNYSRSVTAETDFCATCSKNNDYIFTLG